MEGIITIESRSVSEDKNEVSTEGKGKNEAKAEDGRKKGGGKKQRAMEDKRVMEDNKPESLPDPKLSKALLAEPSGSAKLSENLVINDYGLLEDKEGNVYMFSTKLPMEGFDQDYRNCINYTHITLGRSTKNAENHYINYAGKSSFRFLTTPVYLTGFSSTYGAALYLMYKKPDDDEARKRMLRYAVFVAATRKTLVTKYQQCRTRSTEPINHVKFLGESIPIDGCMGTMVWNDKSVKEISGVMFTPQEFEELQINIGKRLIIAVDPNPQNTLIHVVGRKPEPVKKIDTKSMSPDEKKNLKKKLRTEKRQQKQKFNNSIECCIENAEDSNSDDDFDEDGDGKEQREEEHQDQGATMFFQGSSAQPKGVMTERVNTALLFEQLKNRVTSSTIPAVLGKMVITTRMINHQAIKKNDPPGGGGGGGGTPSMGLPIMDEEDAEKAAGFNDSASSSASNAGYKLAIGSRCASIVILREADQSELESSDNNIIEDVYTTKLDMILCESDVANVQRSCRKRKRE